MAIILLPVFFLVTCISFSGVQTFSLIVHQISNARDTPIVDEDTCFHGICSKTQNYPYRLAREVIKMNQGLQSQTMSAVSNNERNLCDTIKKTIVPESMMNMQNEPRFILQMGSFNQTLELEACVNGSKCLAERCGDDFTTHCRMPMTAIRLYTLNPHTRKHEYEIFPLPYGCVCTFS